MSGAARSFAAAVAALCLAGAAMTAAAQGGKKKESQLRTVRGTVLDASENPLASAVVYLKNVKSSAVTTHISDDSGHYSFSGLDPNVDYEIHAEHGNQTSAKRTISTYDSRKEIVVELKVNKPKK